MGISFEAMATRLVAATLLLLAVVSAVEEHTTVSLDAATELSGRDGPQRNWIGRGKLEITQGVGSPEAGWIHVEPPVQLKWSAANECLHFRDSAKLDSFFCHDDP